MGELTHIELWKQIVGEKYYQIVIDRINNLAEEELKRYIN